MIYFTIKKNKYKKMIKFNNFKFKYNNRSFYKSEKIYKNIYVLNNNHNKKK